MPACQMKSPKQTIEKLGVHQSPNSVRKRTPEIAQRFYHKHMLAIKSVEKHRRDETIVYHVQAWMEKSSIPSACDILRLFDCIERLVKLMDYNFSDLLFPMLIYAERYVQKSRPLQATELFPLLVVACSLAMKMWEDYGPDLELTAHVCAMPKKAISQLERNILEKLNFQLKLTEFDIETFKSVPARAVLGSS